MDGGTIAALILSIIAIIAIIILIIVVITFRNNIFKNGVPYNLIQGNTASPTFVGSGNVVFLVAAGTTNTIKISAPTFNPTGLVFVISNINNTNPVTVTGVSGITVTPASVIQPKSSASYIWSNANTIQQFS